MRINSKLILFLILVFAFAFRVWQVGQIPTFISDEASIGYNAYSILQTGNDEWGQTLPLSFKSFGEYKLPLYIYSVVPWVALFGLGELAVRFSSVLAGALAILALYLLSSRLFSKKVGLLSALFLAISPWHFEVSRIALEANLALTLVLFGFWLLAFAKKDRKAFYLSFILLTLSLYTYNACRVFVPLFLLLYFFAGRRGWQPVLRKNWLAFLVVGVLSLPLFFSGFAGSGQRLAKVGIFQDPGVMNRLIEDRVSCQERETFIPCRLIYNRPLRYSQVFAGNYLSHFSPQFLFTEGSGLAQYSVPDYGALYFFQLPFLLLGIFWLYKKRKNADFIFLWVAAAPIANSLTGSAHPVRSLALLPVFPIATALGVLFFFSFIKGKKVRVLLSLFLAGVIFLSTTVYLTDYFLSYPQKTGSVWQEGYKTLYQKLQTRQDQFDKIVVTKFYGEPHIFYLFYGKYDPASYQRELEVERYLRSDEWVSVDRIGKYYFEDEVTFADPRALYAVAAKEVSETSSEAGGNGNNFISSGHVAWPDGQISFLIGRINETINEKE